MITLCADCEYWFEIPNIPGTGVCRRKAPSTMQANGGPFVGPYNYRVIWPYTRSVDYCGEGEIGLKAKMDEILTDQINIPETKPEAESFDEKVKKALKKNERS